MKRKILCLLITCSLALAISAEAFSDTLNTKYEEAANRLSALGIMRGYEDGSFRPEKNVTRAEFSALITRALGYEDASGMKTPFTDVSEDHWASETISIAEVLGIVNGVGDGRFLPDNEVTYEQAIKMIVTALGYGELAMSKGGYPDGYITVASSKGILKKVGKTDKTPATRGDIVLLLNEAIDVNIADSKDGVGGADKVVTGETLYENLMYKKDMMLYLGIVNANEYANLNGYNIADEDTVIIGDKQFKIGKTNISDMLGYYVKIYASGEKDGIPEVVKFEKIDIKNKIVDIKAENIESLTLREVKFRDNDKLRSVNIKNEGASFIYNGKDIDPNATPVDELMPYNGSVKLISYDGKSEYSTVIIEDVHSFVIDKVNEKNNTIYFKKGVLFNGRNGFKINLEDEDAVYKIVDAENNPIQFSDFRKDMVVSLKSSLDLKINEVILSDESVVGKVTAISSEDGIIEIDDVEYHLTENKMGFPYFPELMTEANFLIDVYGNIVGDSGEIKTTEQYAFVIGYYKYFGNIELEVVHPGNAEKEITVKNDTEVVSYTFVNGGKEVLSLDPKTKAFTTEGSYVYTKDVDLSGYLIKYRMNDSGEISRITYYPALSEKNDYNINTKILSFGGNNVYPGFLGNEKTNFILVPTGYADSTDTDEENFDVDVKYSNGASVTAYAAEVDSSTQIAEIIVLIANMDAKETTAIDDDTPMSIVGRVSNVLNEDDEWMYKITMLTGDELTETYCLETDNMADVVSRLKMGDLIKYNETSKGRIDNIKKYGTIRGLGKEYYRSKPNTPEEEVYGIVKKANLDILSNSRNEMVDELTITLDENDMSQEILYVISRGSDAPTVYRYESSTGNIYSASTDEIIDYLTVGDGATRVFMTVNGSEVEAIVLIEN